MNLDSAKLVAALMFSAAACNDCPTGQVSRTIYVTTLPRGCAMTVTVGDDVVTYSAPCGLPEFHSISMCRPLGDPPAKPPRSE